MFGLLIGTTVGAVEEIVVSGLFRDRAVLVLDGKTRVLSVGATSPEGVKLLSADSREAVVEIAGEVRHLALGEQIRGDYAPPAPGASITIAPDAQGMYEIPGSINGFQVLFLVDTGATLVSMNGATAKRVGLNYKLDGIESRTSTAAGVVPVWLVKLDRVRIGDIEVRDVQASVHDSAFPAEVLLGNAVLQRLHMERDGQLLRLTKP
ncbi:MAG: TIGR02281 family clan AA aspartic protease [Gammaproteobacteria bacterium]|nr:TIGR02281 family clan AA aspartic protease [Gammaproteobacteria bacterium]